MFIDEVTIEVKAGDGGNGAVAFRREKFIPRGGPSGGNGGSGGSVWLVADEGQSTLLDYRYKREYRVRKGEGGGGRDRNGRGSDDIELRVPVGTVVRDADPESERYGQLVADMLEHGQRVRVAKGGRGGLGNMNFATATRQAPTFAQSGTPGEFRLLRLELKMLADAGLVGFPNAGKSTLISRVSAARPKIANYPFTTLAPNLGVVGYRDYRSFVMADIPGLIEGAHEGVGLGHRFLKHVERCRVLIHVVDCGGEEGRNPLEDYEAINRELSAYSPRLASKAQVVAATKLDLTGAEERADELEAYLAKRSIPLHRISAVTGRGLDALLDAVMREIDAAGPPERAAFEAEMAEELRELEESETEGLGEAGSEADGAGAESSGSGGFGSDGPEAEGSGVGGAGGSESDGPEAVGSGSGGAESDNSKSGGSESEGLESEGLESEHSESKGLESGDAGSGGDDSLGGGSRT